jgi:multidrug transporter EmrE-like cation transporter
MIAKLSKPFLDYGLIFIVSVALLASQLLLKHGVRERPLAITGWSSIGALVKQVLTTPALLAGYGISALVALLWLIVLSRMQLSYALPTLNGIFYILLMITSALILREDVTPLRWGGVLLVFIGIVLIARSR